MTQTTQDKIREALDILSEYGYDIFHNGSHLIRSGRSWNWKHVNDRAIKQTEFLLKILRNTHD